jgi:hypothetical protein
VDWLVEANVSEKLAVSIFRTEVMTCDSKVLYRVAAASTLKMQTTLHRNAGFY